MGEKPLAIELTDDEASLVVYALLNVQFSGNASQLNVTLTQISGIIDKLEEAKKVSLA